MLTNDSTDSILESILKEILSEMLQLLEQNIRSKEELQIIQDHLQDYENLQQLAETMKFIFDVLRKKLQGTNNSEKYFKCESKSEHYQKLEQAIQKQEQDIRIHIRAQHEMKIYIDTIQQQLEESEQIRKEYLQETTQLIQKLKKENHSLIQQLKQYTQIQKQQTAQNSRRDSISTINVIFQKQPSKSNHLGNNQEKQEPWNNSQIIKWQLTQNNSQIQLLKNKNSQRSLTQRQLQANRNKSYSLGISKQNSINGSFIQKLIPEQGSKRKSLHAESHRPKGLTDQQKQSQK
ncbi:unnamed protein product [Paramecium octaurelia]|uniref:Uncharacterized protein n=1 Tax=Paramecium octaurelia TaxID=43137 RepID=A0A8S1TWA9_PAROT|nr:unnamed protein product [Paramecium octaurelia]